MKFYIYPSQLISQVHLLIQLTSDILADGHLKQNYIYKWTKFQGIQFFKYFLISSNVSPLGVKTEEFSEASKRHEEVKISYCACLGTCNTLAKIEIMYPKMWGRK